MTKFRKFSAQTSAGCDATRPTSLVGLFGAPTSASGRALHSNRVRAHHMRAQTTSWRPMSRSRSSDGLRGALPWPMAQVESSLDRMSASHLSASNPIGFRAGEHRPLTPEQATFVQGYTSRLARPPPVYATGTGLARAFGLGPDAPYTPRPTSQPFTARPSVPTPVARESPTTPEKPTIPNFGSRFSQDRSWHVSPDPEFGSYDSGSPGNGWGGKTYGGVPTIQRREARASFAAQTARTRPSPMQLSAMLKLEKQQEPGWKTHHSPHWTEWRIRKVGTPSGLGTWN
jgi:hypothetical protein